jgi:hypothetical protein
MARPVSRLSPGLPQGNPEVLKRVTGSVNVHDFTNAKVIA